MKKNILLVIFTGLAFSKNNVCLDQKQSVRTYLDELRAVKTMELKNNERALKEFEIEFEIYADKLNRKALMIEQLGDKNECEKELKKAQKSLSDLKKTMF